MVLTLIGVCIVALLVLAAATRLVPHRVLTIGSAGLSGVIVALAVTALAMRGGPATLAVPFGPMGGVTHLALDPLGASFLLLLLVSLPFATGAPLLLAATALILVAADGVVLVVAVLLLGCATSLRATALAAVGLTLALAFVGPVSDFGAIREAPPDGWYATAVLVLTLSGVAALSWASPALASYLVIRVLTDLCGPVQPLWWGAPLLIAGAVIASVGAVRAACAETLHAAVSFLSVPMFGLSVMGIGLALSSRAADLPSSTATALAAAWLTLVAFVLSRTSLLLCAEAVEKGAGTRRLDRLGGLVHSMPTTTGCCLVGLFALAALPLGIGFAGLWLVVQSLLAAARLGSLPLQLLVAVVVGLVALSSAIAVFAASRLFITAFLGRPRTPRGAVAEDAPGLARYLIGGPAGLVALLSVMPSVALLPASGWTDATAGWLGLNAGGESPGYSSVAFAALLALAWVVLSRAVPRPRGQQREPAWSGGFELPPEWLPFGDPATQYGPGSFAQLFQPPAKLLSAAAAMRRRADRCLDAARVFAAALVAW